MKAFIALLFASLAYGLYGGPVACAADTNPREGVAFYLQTYGQIPPGDLPDVYAIFEQVRAAADRSSLVTPRLVIVRDAPQALAFTLSDGTILLSAKALDVLRGSANQTEIRARIAFVLGHELAHLAANDFWDNQIAQALTSASRPGVTKSAAREPLFVELPSLTGTAADQQKKELKADDLGFLYAALAGYKVDTLLESTRGAEDFLTYWNAQVGRRSDPNYPQAAERSGLLRLRLAELRNALNYFTYGVRLMHFGRYREALSFFQEFQQHFPGRELFNNLGYCHLQMALSYLDPDFAYRYWLPMVSELETPLTRLTTRSASREPRYGRMNAQARENLLTAVRYFERAIEKDAGYVPAHVNLAVAQLMLGMRGAAQGPVADNHLLRAKLAIGAALNLQAEQVDLRMLAAIIDFELQGIEQSGGGEAQRAGHETRSPRIASIGSVDAADPAILYNLAQLTSDEPEHSQRYWQRLLAQFDNLPKKLQALVCRKESQSGGARQARCASLEKARASSAPPWPVPIRLSRDLLQNPFTPAELTQHRWQTLSLTTGTVYSGDENFVLTIDDIAALAVMRPTNMRVDALLQCCGQPVEKIEVARGPFIGSLWHYGQWIAVVKDSRVEELWVSN